MSGLLPSPQLDPWRTAPARLQRVIHETPGVKTYELAFNDQRLAAQFSWQPGQFNMLYVPGCGEAAISISGHDAALGVLRHTVRRVGAVTGALDEGGVGMSLGIRGPFGRGWPLEPFQPVEPFQSAGATQRDLIVVAGGIGLAPLRSMISYCSQHREHFGEVSILVGARKPDDLLYSHQYAGWIAEEFKVQTTVDRDLPGWNGHVGVVTLLLQRLRIRRPDSTFLMTCGPEIMMRFVASAAIERGIPSQHIWVALERNMNCAIGHCGHCQLGPEFVCKDGPVFPFDRVAPWLRVQGL